MAVKNWETEMEVKFESGWYENNFFVIIDLTWTHILTLVKSQIRNSLNRILVFDQSERQKLLYYYQFFDFKTDYLK